MSRKAIAATQADQEAARTVVMDLLICTDCLSELRGACLPSLVGGIAIGIARERERVQVAAAAAEVRGSRPAPTLMPGPGQPTT